MNTWAQIRGMVDGPLGFESVFIFPKNLTSLCFEDLLHFKAGCLLLTSAVFDLHTVFFGTAGREDSETGDIFACSLFVPSGCAISVNPGDGAWKGELRKRLRERL